MESKNSSPTITFDNNCIVNLFDANSVSATSVEELQQIIEFESEGLVQITITTRVEADIENDRNENRKQEFLEIIKKFPVVGSIGRFDVSKWDSGDVWVGDKQNRLVDEIQKVVFPGGLNPSSRNYKNKVNDIDHLVGHFINGHDVFVTDDKAILKKAETLKVSPGIIVKSPTDCLGFLHDLKNRSRTVSLKSEFPIEGYSSKSLENSQSFNFSNNDGKFNIGSGIFLFETQWSRAGADSIHSYSDQRSIDSLALADGIGEIEEVKSVSPFDFTSRARTAKEGEVLILQNTNRYFAAIKILDILNKDRGDDRDELSFQYKIQTNGTDDFS